jgi:hypothetical protein
VREIRMIHELKNGSFRVRWDYGHESRYKKLIKKKNPTDNDLAEIQDLEERFGKPVRIKTRRSACTTHLWQAKEVEKLFKEAWQLESEGKKVPSKLLEYDVCPARPEYLEEVGYAMASICGRHPDLLNNIDFELFLEQADINSKWLKSLKITEVDIKERAAYFCLDSSEDIDLKGKTFLFTGAVTGFTGSEDYLECLLKLSKDIDADGIIMAGEWVKSIFLHKTGRVNNPLPALKKLAKQIPIYALRSTQDKPDLLHSLKKIGITFITGIEDEKNIFLGTRLHKGSAKDQLRRFEEAHLGKNVFVHTSYVGMKSQATEGGDLRYLIGSGSSGYNTPSARFWTTSYDNQLFNSGIRDSIGGHVLRFDKESNCFPTTFRYHEDLKAILYGGKGYFRNKVKQGKLHIVLSDFHATAHHKLAFAAFLRFIEEHKDLIETLALNGDFFDNMLLCHHNKGKFSEQIALAKRDLDVLKEVAYTRECIKEITKRLNPKTKKVYKLGNHEVNSIKSFLNRDTNHFLEAMLGLDDLLELSVNGFEVVGSKVAYKLGEVVMHHGHELQRKGARKIFGKNSTRGHSHGVEIDPDGMTLPGMEDKRKTHYLSHPYVKWCTGFGAITEVDGRSALPQPMLANDEGKYADFAGIKQVKKKVKIDKPTRISLEYSLEWTGREGL